MHPLRFTRAVAAVLLATATCWATIATGSACLTENETAEGRTNLPLRALYEQPVSCWPAPHVDDGVAWQPLGELPPRSDIAPAKRDLGQKLFFDPRLSSSGQIACASCHDPDMGWADGRRLPFGHDRQRGHRNTPSIMNTGYLTHIFWDGRVGSLEEQAKASILNPIEMNATEAQAVRRIAETDGYRPLFEAAFDDDAVTFDRIAGAIADFVRTINTPNTPFDRFLRGDRESLSDAQVRGLHLFRTQARCMNCHSGALFSDETFHHLGTAVYQHSGGYEGRHRVTGAPQDMTAFRVPPLRGTALTGPWMHTGIAPDLRSLLHLYNIGWWQNNALEGQHDDPKFPKLSPLIQPLALSASEISDLEAFLKAISPSPGENRREPPSLP